ncbi:a-glucan phosphorylase, glycosyltransferase family 35 protein [Pedobacter sp. BAL39]|uniref:alpha-glucan family phosphorylase n=1 Tax=Pedobacter sp. BAL39 TaxID=391596 RepID=UPI000155AA29|nr:alpha-glucan family phosphorylase [Pedobacter sp. BAL39]EDM34172.1 a-glucan phosphorylase, glycosyltransferase family 35 protein [Pedobacter sp. BAL39]
MTTKEIFGYEADPHFTKKVAYFSMEFAIDQALKIYSGGLGFLAGSHLRSAYDLKQHLVGVGMLWKYGYYDQTRDSEGLMKPEFVEKQYSFLEDTGIVFTVQVHDSPVHVKAWLLRPETFGAAPLFLLSTDVAENDPVSRSITNNLYDENEATRIAQSIVLGIGGAMLLDLLNYEPEVYHMNEGHSVALNFYLYAKFKSLPEIQKRVVFTTHTPEAAGNESHSYALLKEMSFFYHLQDHEVKFILDMEGDSFNYTLAALKFARKANGVSKIHGKVAQDMWAGNSGICEIIAITNAQHKGHWTDPSLAESSAAGDDVAWLQRKKEMKQDLFKVVSDQCGKLFDPEVLTIVWARRFAGYKRADLIMRDWQRFVDLVSKLDHPVQVIWAGKPYPKDGQSVDLFNKIITRTMDLKNCAVLTGYELGLSALLKKGADVWLNNPTMYREASGTSGMTAAMNGAINLTIPDGWVPEFARDNENCFLIGTAPDNANQEERDRFENVSLLDTLETKVLPTYYERPEQWIKLAETASADVVLSFDSARMATEYYELLY